MGNTKPQPVVCGQPPTLLALVPLFSFSGWCEDDMSSTMPSVQLHFCSRAAGMSVALYDAWAICSLFFPEVQEFLDDLTAHFRRVPPGLVDSSAARWMCDASYVMRSWSGCSGRRWLCWLYRGASGPRSFSPSVSGPSPILGSSWPCHFFPFSPAPGGGSMLPPFLLNDIRTDLLNSNDTRSGDPNQSTLFCCPSEVPSFDFKSLQGKRMEQRGV